MIEARIVLDSINPKGKRLTTWLLTYPRFIHAEFMTHRIFSRNSASSRATPTDKQIRAIMETPALFEQIGAKNKGMTAPVTVSADEAALFHTEWLYLSRQAIDFAESWMDRVAKQVINRALEPWMHMTVLATATDHSNFFRLRAHPAAQPEFQVLAYRMLNAYLRSQPTPLEWGEWHLPGLDQDAADYFSIEDRLKITVALACRASYSAFEDGIDSADAFRIHDRAVENGHWSPFEHPAQAIDDSAPGKFRAYPWSNFDWPGHGGPSGWGQYRKLFEQENLVSIPEADLRHILASRPEWVTV